jgi:hypothetical protein
VKTFALFYISIKHLLAGSSVFIYFCRE